MKTYTVSMRARLTIDVEAETEAEAIKQAEATIVFGGMDLDQLMGLREPYVVVDSTAKLDVVDVYVEDLTCER